ncbi:MAG: hypothetical protein ACXAEN_11935, partial [Candidatus Thorarchaeota archaeon]
MGFFGLIIWVVRNLIKLLAGVIPSIVCALVSIQVLRINPWLPENAGLLSFYSSVVCFGAGFLSVVYKGTTRFLKWGSIAGASAPTGLLISVSSVQIVQFMVLNPAIGLLIIVGCLILGDFVVDWKRGRGVDKSSSSTVIRRLAPSLSVGRSELVSATRVVSIPKEHIQFEKDGSETQSIPVPFWKLLRSMAAQGAPLELRIEKMANQVQLYFITTATDQQTLTSNLEQLEIALSAHLPDFKVERNTVRVPTGFENGVVVSLTGEPLPYDDQRQSCDALTAATEALHTVSDGIIQIHAKPAGSARFSALLKEREVRKLTEKAQKTVAIGSSGLFSKDKQESVVQIDVSAGTKAHRASRELQRLKAEIACDVTVNVCCWTGGPREAEKRARYLMSSLLGALVPADVEADFKTAIRRDRRSFDRVLNGRPVGRGSRLLTTEAVTYFVLPRCDAGIKISRRESFSTASESIPEKKSAVETVSTVEWNMKSIPAAILGTPLNRRGDPIGGKLVWIARDDMDSHLAIYGLPRQGKTTSAFSIVAQLLRSGMVPLIIVPAKSFDWRKFKHLFPTTRIFTAGDSQTSPLRINIWRPPSGVPLAKWLHRLVDVFSAWLPNDDVISMHFDDVLHTMYRNCGWSVRDNIKGRPILLVDFYDAVVEVLNRLDYGPEIRQNFIGALQARLGAIFRNHALVDIFNTQSGITFEELLRCPTIIEMEKLYRDNKRLLAGVLTAGVCEYILANPKPSVDNLLVLEEAHTFLKNPNRPGRESPSSSEMAIESLVEMLRVVGGAGLGVV